MSAKSRSALSDTPNAKPSTPAPRARISRGVVKSNADSGSPLPSTRASADRSPASVTSKPGVRSPKITVTPVEKKTSRIVKPSEIQAELNLAQEDLKKAKEKLALVEKEKVQALDELKQAQKLAEEANGKLKEALVAQKRAEEDSEIEKFRTLELEQVGLDVVQKKEVEWKNELEAVKNQHATDLATLISATEELQKVKQELAATCDAKNQALSHADDATKLAEINAEKVQTISAELAKLQSALESKAEMEARESDKFVEELKSEIDFLRKQLENAKSFEEKFLEKEAAVEQLNVDLEAAKMAESYARNLVEELHERVEELGSQAEQAKRLERSSSESLESVIKQLEGRNASLHDKESEIAALKEKMSLLEISVRRQQRDLDESEVLVELAKKEALEKTKEIESLRSEFDAVKEEKIKALNNEKLTATNVQTLLDEKNKLIDELETSRDEEEKSKKALESLASALHEVSAEARDSKEKLLSIQVEHENYETQIEDLKLVLKATNEKYESMLNDAKQMIDALTSSMEQSKHEHEDSKLEWEEKESALLDSVKKCREENSSMENEINRLHNLLKMAEKEASATREEEDRWRSSCNKAEEEVVYLQEVLGEAKAESMKLKEGLMDKENELQCILTENEELQRKEEASVLKVEELSKSLEEALAKKKEVEELSKSLEEALAKKKEEENGDLTDSEKDYDLLPKVVEFSEENGTGELKPKLDLQSEPKELPVNEKLTEVADFCNDAPDERISNAEKVTEKTKGTEKTEKESEDLAEVEFKMWESCKIEEKDYSLDAEPEQESAEDEVESKGEAVESDDKANRSPEHLENGAAPGMKQSSSQKKKKPLFGKFGSLLKKKSSSPNPK